MPSTPLRQKPARRHKPELTLDRLLSRSGLMSRAQAAEAIRAGRVSLQGRRISDPLTWVEAKDPSLRLDGRRLKNAPRQYWVMHKPKGVLTAHGDARGRKTVYDLIAQKLRLGQEGKWLFPVGRLDLDSSGLLLLTNDSIFAERITQPATKVPKTYLVKVNAIVDEAGLARLRQGLDIGRGERSGPAEINYIGDNGRFCRLEITLTEGKNRQVRRMLEALGHTVLKLVRTRIGKLELADLPPGEFRKIRPDQI